MGRNEEGVVSDSYAMCNVSAPASFSTGVGSYVGGLIGSCYQSTIVGSYSTGSVIGDDYLGGLVGWNNGGTISTCYSTGTVTGDLILGGLVGQNDNSGVVVASYATGNVTGAKNSVGGLVGANYSTSIIKACYASGTVKGSSSLIGGLVGYNSNLIVACYATGRVEGLGTSEDLFSTIYVGGLVGRNYGSSSTISASYAIGDVSGLSGDDNIGGLVGSNGGAINDSYYNSDATITNTQSGGSVNTEGSTQTTSALQASGNYGATSSDIYPNGTWNVDVDDGLSIGVDDGENPGDDTEDDPWDFGTNSEYPALKVDFNRNGTATWEEFGDQRTSALPPPTTPAPIIDSFAPEEGAPNTDVTIMGQNFSAVASGNEVSFNGTAAATPTNVSTTSLTVRVPSGATTGPITVTVDGQTGTSNTNFTVLALPPSIDYDTDNDGLIEVSNLEQLNAIRWDLDGDGEVLSANEATYGAAFPTTSGGTTYGAIECGDNPPTTTCSGYELMNSIDFNDVDGSTSGDQLSVWAEDAVSASVLGAVTGGWLPIGYYNTSSDKASFTSIFEGNDKTISNLYINRPSTRHVGMFGYVTGSAEIRNVGLIDVDVTGTFDIGGLVGDNWSTITSCYTTGEVSGNADIGGLVGDNNGEISACYSTADVTGINDADGVGGLVGENSRGTIVACYATGTVTASHTESDYVGGLVGENGYGSRIRACYATGDVTGSDHVGGLVGKNWSGVPAASTNSSVIGACYATGHVLGNNSVGGLVGYNGNGAQYELTLSYGSWIISSYAVGNVTGNGSNVGGLVGYNFVYSDGITGTAKAAKLRDSYYSASAVIVGGDNTDGEQVKSALQMPTAYSTISGAIYYEWNRDIDGRTTTTSSDIVWNFGTNGQYPVLKVDFDRNGTASVAEFGDQRTSAPPTPNAAPVFVSAPYSFTQDEEVATDTHVVGMPAISAMDADNDPLQYLLTDDGSGRFMINPQSGVISNAEVIDYEGLGGTLQTNGITLEVQVSDGNGGTANADVTIMITDVNEAPPLPLVDSFDPPMGAVDDQVVITGRNFSDTPEDNMVSFNGTAAATPTNVSTTSLTVRVPSGATTGRISVTVDGQVGTSSTEFTVLALPPSIDYDTDNDGLIEVSNLEQLNAIRWDLDGDGEVLSANEATYGAAFPTTSGGSTYGAIECGDNPPTTTCSGYELMNSIDFNDVDGSTSGDQLSVWAEGAASANVAGAVTGGWLPIGSSSSNSFTAIFEGNSKMISNLFIDRSSTLYVGLFGYLTTGAEIRNLGVLGGNVTGAGPAGTGIAGGLVGSSYGTISACYTTGNAESTGSSGTAGGLVGSNGGTISACYATGNAESTASNIGRAGGLVGHNHQSGTISASYATGNATSNTDVGGLVGNNNGGTIIASHATGTATGDENVGGLVGSNSYSGEIIASHANGNAEATGDSGNAGGLVGHNHQSGTISACYAIGTATASSNGEAGGLVGNNNNGTIIASYATGTATGDDDAGGLVGSNGGTISACYATGTATGGDRAGGLVGINFDRIIASYATGDAELTGQYGRAGGLVGSNNNAGTVTNSYFDRDVSNRPATDDYSQTTSELESPTGYTGIYSAWNLDLDNGLSIGVDDGENPGDDTEDDPWDFGANSEYPALKVDFDRNGTASVAEFGNQPRIASLPPTSSLEIRSFSPGAGAVGDLIKIAGTGFSTTVREDSVSFGGSAYVVADNFIDDTRTGVDPTIDTVVVNVPSNAETGTISVKVLDRTAATSADEFEVVPTITNIVPEMAQVNATIKIAGTGFSSTFEDDSVLFSGSDYVAASNFIAYDAANGALDPEIDTVVVTVPSDAQTGVVMLKVLDGTATTSTQTFTVEGSVPDPTPEITSIDPESGSVGADVTISGQHFGSTPTDNEVTFLGVEPDPSPSDKRISNECHI